MIIRTYTELCKLKTFNERYEYLRIGGKVGVSTFGFDRYLNQLLYTSGRWLSTRDAIIIRDNGCDLGMPDREIFDSIIIHHMNPLSVEDIEEERDEIFEPEFLISTMGRTHNAIHFGNKDLLYMLPVVRTPNDTSPWRLK